MKTNEYPPRVLGAVVAPLGGWRYALSLKPVLHDREFLEAFLFTTCQVESYKLHRATHDELIDAVTRVAAHLGKHGRPVTPRAWEPSPLGRN